MASYGGVACLGFAVHVAARKCKVQCDRVSFFGVDGTYSIYGGSRGFVYDVSGVLWGVNVPEMLYIESLLYGFSDAVPRDLVDDVGRVWSNVIFLGEYVPHSDGPKWTDNGVCLPYSARFYGLV